MEVALRDFEALSRRDADGMAACYAEDAVADFVPLGPARGRAEIAAFFRELFTAVPDIETTYEVAAASEGTVVVEWRTRGTFTGGQLQGIDPNGRELEIRGCDILRIEGDHIVHNTAYYDGMEMARGIGMLPPMDSAGERAMKAAFNAKTKLAARFGR